MNDAIVKQRLAYTLIFLLILVVPSPWSDPVSEKAIMFNCIQGMVALIMIIIPVAWYTLDEIDKKPKS